MPTTILITGASAGIGRSLAQMLASKDNCRVYAASRNAATEGANSNIIPLTLDVNSAESVQKAVQQIISENAVLDALVCNAGNGIAGAAEEMTLEEVRYQMETNFFGAVRVIQEVLPLFRSQGFGKIIVTASVAGVVPIPFQSVYSASKAAVMAFVEAVSLEVKPFGIDCCCVLPGDTKTGFTAARRFCAKARLPLSPYRERFNKSISKMEKDEQNGVPPEKVARAIARQLRRKKMQLRVPVGWDYRLICYAFGLLPSRLKMWIVGLLYG